MKVGDAWPTSMKTSRDYYCARVAPLKLVENGIYGLPNSSLSVTAMFMFYVPSRGTAPIGIFVAVVTVAVLTIGSLQSSLMALPFCVLVMSSFNDHPPRDKMLKYDFHLLKKEAIDAPGRGQGEKHPGSRCSSCLMQSAMWRRTMKTTSAGVREIEQATQLMGRAT
jgi:hypothetical protein